MFKVVVITLVFVLSVSVCFALDSGLIVEDYKKIRYVIEYLGRDELDTGLTEKLVKSKIELQLRRNGLTPVEPTEDNSDYYKGYLYININTFPDRACTIRVQYMRNVLYMSSQDSPVYAVQGAVYTNTTLINTDIPDHIFKYLADRLDVFINEYLKANEK